MTDQRSESPRMAGLATDLYQLTMAAAYLANDRHERASFELFVRSLPHQRSYLVVAGLNQAIEYLQRLSFSSDEIAYLRGLPVFAGVSDTFFDYLGDFSFTGDLWAMPEGTVAFANEPLLRVTAPLIEAQIVETYLLSTINFQTSIATKASRVAEAARGKGVIEFGARRCHGFGAAIEAARAAFIGGCIGTSNVEAGRLFDIPVFGTAAHSFTMAFDDEIDAFRAYHKVFPESTTLLLDTYDTIHAAHLATEFGPGLRGVRLDSGDMTGLSREVRRILDEAGMTKTRIMASGDLDEFKIAKMLEEGAQIDLFGVGTELSTSRDAPALGGIYKLVEVDYDHRHEPKMKLSSEKATYPFRKQVWRTRNSDGMFEGDLIAIENEMLPSAEPLLSEVMRGGRLINQLPGLENIRARAAEGVSYLHPRYRKLTDAAAYPVRYSDRLEEARSELMSKFEVFHP